MTSIVSFIVWILTRAINVYMLAIVVYALLSWFPGAYASRIGRFIAAIVEPFQKLFNFAHVGMLSFAPIVALIVLSLVQNGIIYLGQLLVGY